MNTEGVLPKETNFNKIYSQSNKLAAAVFVVSDLIENSDELKAKIKNLSIELVSLSVNLKDINFIDTKKLIKGIEKKSLELLSLLDIASISGLISKMNGMILKGEFQMFVSELENFHNNFENNKNLSVRGLFLESLPNLEEINKTNNHSNYENCENMDKNGELFRQKKMLAEGHKNNCGLKRKDLRKNTILDFIKRHNNASIKDIVPNITGCSEKTVQRELIELIKEGRVVKNGERRWSKYSII